MLKIVSTLLRRQCLGEPSDQFQEPRHGARRTLAQRRLQLRERLLDGIEIGRVGGQIPQRCCGGFDRLSHPRDLVATLWEGRLSMNTMPPLRSVGTSTCWTS